ncbi:MAG: class I SAM-dependent methyltransferase [Leptospirales bacterium]
MIVGNKTSGTYGSKRWKLLVKVLGSLDLHTQIRIKPLKKYILDHKSIFDKKKIIEIGCSSGVNCFEILFNSDPDIVLGFDLNQKSINSAIRKADALKVSDKVKFHCTDATEFDFSKVGKVDCVLLMDFLEHINNPEKFLSALQTILNEETTIIISVPTYNYKKIFGEKFHLQLGHLRDGYSLGEIRELFKEIDYEVVEYSYNTGLLGAFGCFLYYRILLNNNSLAKQLLLYPFHFIDFFNNERLSASLFAVLKVPNATKVC